LKIHSPESSGPLVAVTPMQSPDAPLAGVNGTAAENNHGYPPNHDHGTHANGVPSTPLPNGYGDDTKGQG
jgi:hypothetical protein